LKSSLKSGRIDLFGERHKKIDPFPILLSCSRHDVPYRVPLTRHPGMFLAEIQCLCFDQKTQDARPLVWRGTSYEGRGKDTGCLPTQA
jgi:hypothetical protein